MASKENVRDPEATLSAQVVHAHRVRVRDLPLTPRTRGTAAAGAEAGRGQQGRAEGAVAEMISGIVGRGLQ